MAGKSERQISFQKVYGWGGKRVRAGRPNRTGAVNHMKRAWLNIKHPLHITMRVETGIPNLRNKKLLRDFKKCARLAKVFHLYVVHFSLQSNHIHMIVETPSNRSLGRGMRSLAGRFGKLLRKHMQTHGRPWTKPSVFTGRYHLHVLKTPQETKRALEYVLLNRAKHLKWIEHFDIYSSAISFQNWTELLGRRFAGLIADQAERLSRNRRELADLAEALAPPQSWLCKHGWKRAATICSA